MKTCPECNAQNEQDNIFCTECGYRFQSQPQESVAEETTVKADTASTPEEMEKADNHIMWNIQPGQVARIISETEFGMYDNVEGLIVAQGTRVLVRRNASDSTMLTCGIYTFEKGRSAAKGLKNFFDRQFKNKAVEPVFYSVLLVRDGDFPILLAGAGNDASNYVPIKVNAKNLDIEIGLSAMLKVGSLEAFAAKWLTDRKRLFTEDIVKEISPRIETVIREALAGVEVTENGLPEAAAKDIAAKLKALDFGGITISEIEDIRIGNDALERFRELNSEMYLSGRELDFLERTNDFKNRLAALQNAQQIEDAKNDLALMRALQQINKDKILEEDELEKFYTVLSREKKIREAREQEQIDAALADIARTGLVRDEDLNRLKDEIRSEEYRRGHAFRMMQKKDELELASLQREYEKRVREEDYQFSRRAKEDDYQFDKKKKDDEFDRFKELDKIRSEKEASEHERNMQAFREMQQAKLERMKLSRELTPEQLMAIAANENLSPEAAAKFAESLGKGRDMEAERRHQEELQKLNQARIDDMKDMSRTEHETVREIIRSMSPSAQKVQPQQAPSGDFKFCPQCGTKCDSQAKFCMSCGNKLA